MILLLVLNWCLALTLGWALFGYYLWLGWRGFQREEKDQVGPQQCPKLSIIVPCYNEAQVILRKLADLRAQSYPSDRLEVVFADGGSSDGSVELLRDHLRPDEPFRVVQCGKANKVHQINAVLPQLHGDIVVSTDADSFMAPDALRWLAAEFTTDPLVGVVGAHSQPTQTSELEEHYGDSQNKVRLLESQALTAFTVAGACYAFRRNLQEVFPPDVVADNVYIALRANADGWRTVYSDKARVFETRLPRELEDFLPRKYCSANSLLREQLRFLHLLPEFTPRYRLMFLSRLAQQLLLAWFLLMWVMVVAALLTMPASRIVLLSVGYSVGMLVLLSLLTGCVFRYMAKGPRALKHRLKIAVTGCLLQTLLLLATGGSYPLFRQTANYSRLPQE